MRNNTTYLLLLLSIVLVNVQSIKEELTQVSNGRRILELPKKYKHLNHYSKDSIFYAIKMDDVELVKKYIEEGVDINEKTKAGDPILVFALSVYPINEEIIKLILAEDPDINLADANGYTPLIKAAMATGDQVGITQLILDEGPELELKSTGEYTALFQAIRQNNVGVVELLIYAGSDVNTVSSNYYSHPLCYSAAEFGRNSKTLVKLLLEAKAIVDARDLETDRTALMHTGDVTITEMLVNAGANVNAIDNKGYNALMLIEHSEIIEFLLKNGAKVNVVADDGSTAIMWAQELEAVKSLIGAGEDVNAKDNEGKTAMLYMDQLSGDKALELIKAGADVNVQDKDKRTALMLTEDTYLARVLTSNGINVDLKDKDGKAALLYFSDLLLFNDQDVVTLIKLLGDAKADFKTKDKDGNTAIHYIVRVQDYTYEPLLDACLKYGSDINAQNNEGNTPLMWASIKGHSALIEYLVKEGADLSIENKMGYTAKDLLCACQTFLSGSRGKDDSVLANEIDSVTLYEIEPSIEKLYCFSYQCPSKEILEAVFA